MPSYHLTSVHMDEINVFAPQSHREPLIREESQQQYWSEAELDHRTGHGQGHPSPGRQSYVLCPE